MVVCLSKQPLGVMLFCRCSCRLGYVSFGDTLSPCVASPLSALYALVTL